MRRPPGLKSAPARRLFDQLVAELEADSKADREQVALAVRYRLKSDALLAADRLTASNEAGRRADAILRALRRRPGLLTTVDDGDSPRLRWLRTGGLELHPPPTDDEDVLLVRALMQRRGHWNDCTSAERAWMHGETDEPPALPTAA